MSIGPGELVSLRRMLELNASAFYRATAALRTLRMTIIAVRKDHPKEVIEKAVDAEVCGTLQSHIAQLQECCNAMIVPSTRDAVLRLSGAVNNRCSYGHLDELVRDVEMRLADDLERVKLLILDAKNETRFYDGASRFGKAEIMFPSASFDIAEASKCLALRRYTASVFHMMRVIEVGLRSVSLCLGAPDPTKPSERNWGFILRGLSEAIDNKQGEWKASDEKEFFSGVYLALDRVRTLWRNATMHIENKYTEDEADEVYEAVRVFMKKLASRLDEKGEPFA